MASFDSIVVTGDWIAEHYLTSSGKDSFATEVKARHRVWKEDEGRSIPTPRSKFSQGRTRLLQDLSRATEADSPDTSSELSTSSYWAYVADLLDVLGFVPGRGREVTGTDTLRLVAQAGAAATVAVVVALPAETVEDAVSRDGDTLGAAETLPGFDAEMELSKPETFTNAARLTSALFQDDPDLQFILIVAGRWMIIGERERWAEGRHLAVNMQAVAERNDVRQAGETDTALTVLSAESFVPDAEGNAWWTRRLEDSIRHSVGVSKDLRDGVRESIEILASEVVRRRKDAGLDPLPADQAQTLARQSLRYLYRILFLLYAEASPELEVLPVGAPEYERGYSLDRLRDLVQTELATPSEREGTHLYASLQVLFQLVDRGYTAQVEGGLQFNALRADLFLPEAIGLIDQVGLGNDALQQVLSRLLLSKETRGKDRGFISYAELGINQLGAVYEGLMSYTGFFAEATLYEVARKGNPEKGSWVVPADRIEGIDPGDFVMRENPVTGAPEPVVHEPGSFVFRLAGRERQQSASYYTPEVLTRFTVSQALEELIPDEMPAEDILQITVCEAFSPTWIQNGGTVALAA